MNKKDNSIFDDLRFLLLIETDQLSKDIDFVRKVWMIRAYKFEEFNISAEVIKSDKI